MTALDSSTHESPNLLWDLEMWEKVESNVPVCVRRKYESIIEG